MLDVIVIGAGPIGSRVAEKLASLGYQTMVLENRPDIGEKPCCTGIISQECISTFNIPDEVIYRKAYSAKIFAPSGEMIRVYRPEPQASIVNRKAFDIWMADRAKSKGVRYQLRCQAEYISIRPEKAVVGVNQEGFEYQLESQAVVIAAGFNSVLVNNLDLGQPGYFTAGAQAEVETDQIEEVEVYFDQKLAPGFFAWLVPTANGKALAGLMTRSSPGYHLREWIQQLATQGRIKAVEAKKWPLKFGGIPLKAPDRTYKDRVLVAGDAAGQVKPTTGGGIYFGLICADLAANTLHKALASGDLSSNSLAIYENNWRQTIGRELRKEYFARKIYERLTNRQIDRLFSILNSNKIVESLLREEQISFDRHGGLMLKVLKLGLQSQVRKLFHLR